MKKKYIDELKDVFKRYAFCSAFALPMIFFIVFCGGCIFSIAVKILFDDGVSLLCIDFWKCVLFGGLEIGLGTSALPAVGIFCSFVYELVWLLVRSFRDR